MANRTGVLLLNIGSPRSYEVEDVKKYLKTFLMDKDVINSPFFVRWPLVHGIIVPRRASYSAANYKKVWISGEGSPLLVYTQRFSTKLQNALGNNYIVKTGMRYSDPSIAQALLDFHQEGVRNIILLPLYPQYAEATTGSSLKEVRRQMNKLKLSLQLTEVAPFFDNPEFIKANAQIANEHLRSKKAEHFLFSFHGLPESHVRKVAGCRLDESCCAQKAACAKNCYRAQCYATAEKIAQNLGLLKNQWSVSFQSRLGRAEWLKPSTDATLEDLALKGIKNLAVLCPSFVADCLETIEEIGMGGKELFLEKGGSSFELIPCVNDNDFWVQGCAQMISKCGTV